VVAISEAEMMNMQASAYQNMMRQKDGVCSCSNNEAKKDANAKVAR
jgi:hypothetical protein